jgi:hypothetical protein
LLVANHVDVRDVAQPVRLGVHQALKGDEFAARELLEGPELPTTATPIRLTATTVKPSESRVLQAASMSAPIAW